ncbi:restriction endonuclease subunit M [Tissierella creatinophila]|uniref:Putative type I restriction enzymeP M protein n=1 Tax=Tissierella creatinophila DSM 6911 TaxID=1123403 RepID=A0A1U7M541_TISCR|nr:N-6 DNA methylase [Tissierella creatinophila]OLS02427.1 putative type I restriction enzymeP M protein [Tissierella creatinophila DSM 6911]
MEITKKQKEIINAYIEQSKIKAVESIDFVNKKVKYSNEILNARNIDVLSGDEEIVRAYIITKLANELGYPLNKIVIEYEYTAGRPHTITSRIDLIVKDKNDDAFLFIELKPPKQYETLDKDSTIEEQLFKVAGMEKNEGHNVKYLVLYTINFDNLNNIKDTCMIIDNEKYPNFAQWESVRNYTDTLPDRYSKVIKKPYIKNSDNDLEKSFTHEMLHRLQIDLHNVLWGGGGTDDNEIFSSLTNLILAKIQDEDEKMNGDAYDFQALSFVNDEDEFESNDVLFERINELYKRALSNKLNIVDKNELKKSYVIDTKKFSLSKLKYTVQQLEKYSFVDGKNSLSGKDILGDFFEGIIRNGFKQDKGQFFTHINIVKFMLWGIQADRLAIDRINKDKEIPYMIDPSAGSGTFLIEYMKFITENIKYKYRSQINSSREVTDKMESEWFYPNHRENKWAREYIYGTELNFNLGTATKVNMILHGDGSTNIFVKDGLLPFNEYVKENAPNALNKAFKDNLYKYETNSQFDLILTNPPFSVDLDKDTAKRVKKNFIFGNKKNSENLFIERYYQLLRENGRMAIILPESIFDTNENRYIRLFLYKYFNIKAIVSLPQSTFAPFTNTKTSIIFAQKKTSEQIELWDSKWNIYTNEWSKLKNRVLNIIDVHHSVKSKEKLPSIKSLSQLEEIHILAQMLKNNLTIEDSNDIFSFCEDSAESDVLEFKESLIKKYEEDLISLCKVDNDTKAEFGFVNTWWVFSNVANELSYNIFMAEADEIGYKRTIRGERKSLNNLFRSDSNDKLIIDDGNKETILDYMRDIEWDEER